MKLIDNLIAGYWNRPWWLLFFLACANGWSVAVCMTFWFNPTWWVVIPAIFSIIIALDVIDNAGWHFYHHHFIEWFD